MNSRLNCLFLFTALMLAALIGSGQPRTGIGFTAGFNKPFSPHYNYGSGYALTGSIALNSKWSICPYLGVETLKGDNEPVVAGTVPYTITYKGRYLKAGVLRAGVNGQYYISPKVFVMAGAFPYIAVGNEDTIDGGIGGTGAIGINLPVDNIVRFNFAAFTDVLYIAHGGGKGVTPYIGLRGTIFFDFARPIFGR